MARLRAAPQSLFWYWINERHRIYIKREEGKAKPWTDDPILQRYKFTNVFRQLDTGTVWLQEHFILPQVAAGWKPDALPLLIGNVGWYRMFNWTGTGALLGWQKDWRPSRVRARLTKAHDAGEQVFTGAHIVWSEKGKPKIDGVVDTCTSIWKKRKQLAHVCMDTLSMQAVFEELTRVRGVGGFMAYEMVCDLRHSPALNMASDINTWANVGPGAMRGLRRLWPGITTKEALPAMVHLLGKSVWEIEDHVPALELREIEHSLCEFDKYCRVKFGEGEPRSTYPGTEETT